MWFDKKKEPSFFLLNVPKLRNPLLPEHIVTKYSNRKIDTTPALNDMTRETDDSEVSKTFNFSFVQVVESDDLF